MSGSKHANATSFQKGKSGNPSGRVKGVERRFREIAEERVYQALDGKEYRGVEALANALLDIALNRKEEARDRRAAIDSFVDRGWGKVKQELELSGDAPARVLDVSRLSDEQLKAIASIEFVEAEPDPGAT